VPRSGLHVDNAWLAGIPEEAGNHCADACSILVEKEQGVRRAIFVLELSLPSSVDDRRNPKDSD